MRHQDEYMRELGEYMRKHCEYMRKTRLVYEGTGGINERIL